MTCVYSLMIFDIVFISKAALCSIPVTVSKWFLYTPFLLWILENALSLLWDVTQPLGCVIEETVLGEFKRGLKGRRVHADTMSTLSPLSLTFHPVNSHIISRDFTILLCSHLGVYMIVTWLPFLLQLWTGSNSNKNLLLRIYKGKTFFPQFFSPQGDKELFVRAQNCK